jgi:nucleoside-diphosphate-sugar epimerase
VAVLLLIGGTGFFGKSILDAFASGKLNTWGIERIIAMSRNAERLRDEAPELLSKNIELLSADIVTADKLPRADVVIHAASSVDIRLFQNGAEDARNNIERGTENFVRLAEKYLHSSSIVYVSSGAVYGVQDSAVSHISEEYCSDIDALPEYKRAYAYAKRASEAAIRQLGEAGLKVSIARCFSFIGRWLPRDQQYAIGNFIEDGIHGRSVKVQATRKVFRSYMHVDDLVEWLMAIAWNANTFCSVYNVGSGEEKEMREIAAVVAEAFKVDVEAAEIVDSRVDRYVPSVQKAMRELGVSLKFDFQHALQKVIVEMNRLPRSL